MPQILEELRLSQVVHGLRVPPTAWRVQAELVCLEPFAAKAALLSRAVLGGLALAAASAWGAAGWRLVAQGPAADAPADSASVRASEANMAASNMGCRPAAVVSVLAVRVLAPCPRPFTNACVFVADLHVNDLSSC